MKPTLTILSTLFIFLAATSSAEYIYIQETGYTDSRHQGTGVLEVNEGSASGCRVAVKTIGNATYQARVWLESCKELLHLKGKNVQFSGATIFRESPERGFFWEMFEATTDLGENIYIQETGYTDSRHQGTGVLEVNVESASGCRVAVKPAGGATYQARVRSQKDCEKLKSLSGRNVQFSGTTVSGENNIFWGNLQIEEVH